MVPALVLTAGLATRLRPLSFVRAKAALPVAGVPLVTRILRSLAGAGVTDAVLNLHHLPHTLTSIVGDGSPLGVRVRYSWEDPVLGSAGGPRRAVPLLSSPFLIVNGDTMTDCDLRALVDHHRASGALVTMAVVPNTEPDKYSGLIADRDGALTGFATRSAPDNAYHFIGVQVAEAEAFESIPAGLPFETRALYDSLIASRPGAIRVFETSAEFFDIGTPADYLDTSLRIGDREGHGPGGGHGARVDPSARVERSVLWDDVIVEAGSLLRECVVTDGVRVPADTSWHGVTMRVATSELGPGERRIEDLAIASL
jgi:NDP-sugar pyrophosphorylase family protein